MSEVDVYTPPMDPATLMMKADAEATIADMNARIAAVASGRLALVGTITITETSLVSLSLGMKRKAVPLTGIKAGDALVFVPAGVPTAGCEAVNVYPAGEGSVTVAYFTPALGIGASLSIPLAVYRITA